MAGVVSGCVAPQQGPILQGGTSRPRLRERRGTSRLADRRVRRGLQVSSVVVRRVGGSSRGRSTAGGSRQIGLRPESPQRSVLAGTAGESVRQVSTVSIIIFLARHKLRLKQIEAVEKRFARRLHSESLSCEEDCGNPSGDIRCVIITSDGEVLSEPVLETNGEPHRGRRGRPPGGRSR